MERPVAVLVPVKDFRQAKRRLAAEVGAEDRARLARKMATTVVEAAAPHPTAVVCDDDDVAIWAREVGARVLWTPGLGLNGAVQHGVEALGAEGVRRVVVAHGDLPLATSFSWLATPPDDGVILVPDRHLGGTNVASVPTDAGFRFAYGTGSFARHRAEGRRCGLVTRVVRDERLGWDVDVPVDLILPGRTGPG